MATILITGANRGLGLEFTKQYLASGWDVIACCRNPSQATELLELKTLHEQAGALDIQELDLDNFASIDQLALSIGQKPIDILLNNAGVFGPKVKAEQDFRQNLGHMDYDLWASIFKVNTMAPVKMAESFYQNVKDSEHKKIINISSVVGSIATAQDEAELFAYRTSKAALNMVTKILADKLPTNEVIAAAICPGWVQTDMGSSAATFTPYESISMVRKTIASLSHQQSGSFVLYDGSILPW